MEKDMTTTTPRKSKKAKTFIVNHKVAKITFLILLSFFMDRNNVQAQCNIVAPYICINVNSAASNVNPTTVDLSSMTATSHWAWMSEVGVVWSTTANPTLSSNLGKNTGPVTTTPNGGTMAAFTLTGLTPGTTYYVRSYGTYNNASEASTAYGPQISFTTTIAGPTVTMTTAAATAITATSATSGGSATPTGGLTVVERGIVYSTVTNPTTANTKVISGAGAGSYVSNLTGLTSSTTYYIRSYSIDNLGVTRYGPNQSFVTSFLVSGIVSPFSLTPDWYFGTGARYTFPSGSYPAVPPGPIVAAIATNVSASVETSTGVSFRTGNIAVYTNTMQAFNGGHAGSWTPNARNFNPLGDNRCGGSATGGGVSFPDPANNATNDAFYLIIANDLTGGACAGSGINEYRFTGTGTTVAYNAGPTLLATSANSSEALAAGTDGSGGYWVVSHSQASNNNFYVWHYTASGRTGPVTQTPTTASPISITTSGGYIKFSPCMNKIAFAGFSGYVDVYEFNRVAGTIGTQLASINTGKKHGVEFSPDGNYIFASGLGTPVSWYLISNPATTGTVAGSVSWSMQLGPDAQIYTSGNEGATTGVINDPNATKTHSAISLASPSTSYRGITNIAWLSPQTPIINAVEQVGCNTYSFSMLFNNYFNDAVNVKTNSYSWNFGDGSPLGTGATPTHTYPSGINSYTVTLTFRDSCCNELWTATLPINTTCTVAPVNFISFCGNRGNHLSSLTDSTFLLSKYHYFKDIGRRLYV